MSILRIGFTVAPILYGLDKVFNLMTDWTEVLPGFVTDIVSGAVGSSMRPINNRPARLSSVS